MASGASATPNPLLGTGGYGGFPGYGVAPVGGYGPTANPTTGQTGAAGNAGYSWNPVSGTYTPTATSPATQNQLLQTAVGQQQQKFNTGMQQEGQIYNAVLAGLQNPSGGLFGMPNVSNFTAGLGSGTSIPPPTSLSMPDPTAATNAQFARAMDAQGQQNQGAIKGLNSALAGEGLLGSGTQGAQTGQIVQQGAENLANLTREQAIQNLNTANQFATTQYQGGIQQRGQNIQQQESQEQLQENAALAALQAALQLRGQNIGLFGSTLGSLGGAVNGLVNAAPITGYA